MTIPLQNMRSIDPVYIINVASVHHNFCPRIVWLEVEEIYTKTFSALKVVRKLKVTGQGNRVM